MAEYVAYLKEPYFQSNLISLQLKSWSVWPIALFLDVAADLGSKMFLSPIFCALMMSMLLSVHSKYGICFLFFYFLKILPWKICFKESQKKHEKYLPHFGPQVHLTGSLLITLVVRLSLFPSLNISETGHQLFLKFCMKLGINEIKKVTQPEF